MKKAEAEIEEGQQRDEKAIRQGTSTMVVVVVVVFNLATSGSESHVNQIEDMHHNAGMHVRNNYYHLVIYY